MSFDIILLDFLGMPSAFWIWLLASLGVFLLGWFLNSILSGHKRRADALEQERDQLHDLNVEHEKQIASLKYDVEKKEIEKQDIRDQLSKMEMERIGLLGRIEELGGSTDSRSIQEATKVKPSDEESDS
jgi:hypothetical protein